MSAIFDAEFFEKLNQMQLAAHIRLDRGQTGRRKSSAKGASVEFSDFREYFPGDDIRRVDWNAYGRFDKLYIKEYMEEKEVFYHIFVDASASMDFGEQKKSVMALRLAAIFAWMALKQLDRARVLTFHDGRLSPGRALRGRNAFGPLLGELEQTVFGGTTGMGAALRQYSLNGRGYCILISDFLEPAGIDEALRYLAYKRQEILLVQVLAREETDFMAEGTLALQDMETEQSLRVTMTRQSLSAYEKRLADHETALAALAARYGCKYLRVVSDEPLEKIIREIMTAAA